MIHAMNVVMKYTVNWKKKHESESSSKNVPVLTGALVRVKVVMVTFIPK